jgi:Holliday junction resolvase RusA-like endonuclease
MIDLTFEVLGAPVPQHRPRFSRAGKFVRTYNVKEDTQYREKLYWEARKAVKAPISRGVALRVDIEVFRSAPASLPQAKRALLALGVLQPATRPDIDNYLKQIFDGLNGIVWEDDGQIVTVMASKWYSDRPGIRVRVRSIE